jgi:hypothetical protein
MSKIKFLLANRGKGVVDSNNPITEDDLLLVENEKELISLNTSATKSNIFQIGSTVITESVTELKPLELTGNVLTVKVMGENGVVQEAAIDLSSISTNSSGISNASYNASTNIITLTEDDGSEHTIDLSEFSIIRAVDANGVVTLTQEGVVKATISKAGESGQYDDLLGKPSPYSHPTQTTIDTGVLTGAEVISRVSVDSKGHTTVVSTRTLTAANIGAAPTSHNHAGEEITSGTVARARVGVKPIKTILTEDLTAGKYIAIGEDKNYWLHFNTGADATIQIDDSFGPDFELEGNAAINNTLTVEGIGGCNVYYPSGYSNVVEKKGVFGWKQNGGNYGYLFGALIQV